MKLGEVFLKPSTLPYELPDFAKISDADYLPGFELGVAEQLAEIASITSQPEVTFENTVEALERSGRTLNRVLFVFFNKSSADTNEEIEKLEAEIGPRLAAHSDSIHLNQELFRRLFLLEQKLPSLGLDTEEQWLLSRYLKDFRFAGAELSESARARVAEINERIASLQAEFAKRLLADSNDLAIHLPDDSRLRGLDDGQIASAKQAAKDRGVDGYVIPLLNYSGHPLLSKLEDRKLRQEILERTLSRGGRGNENDTRDLVLEMLRLRGEKARLFGYSSYAAYVTAQQTAGSPENVHRVLRQIAPIARRNAEREHQALQLQAVEEDIQVAAWDWDRFTERERALRFNVDTDELRPYFELNSVLESGVFYVAEKLYGFTFKRREDLVGYHPDVIVYEVFRDSTPHGLYLFDPYARTSKRGGAWMNTLVDQNHLLDQRPIVVNNMNIPKPAPGAPTLLTFDEVNTLFHEFGHTLHGLLSDVKFPRFSGTAVDRDFVEFPSQVNEMWMLWPEVLDNYARHHETGRRLDPEIGERLAAASAFNQGFETTHYLAAAVLDLALHEVETLPEDLIEFEAEAIADYGLDFAHVPTRYRTTYFSHIFDGGYSAGYYGYIWSEILDADTVDWFKENGGLSRANGEWFAQTLLSRGGSQDSMEMYARFRGRPADIKPLMTRRGLL